MKHANENQSGKCILKSAVGNFSMSYHTSIGCEPNRVVHKSIPYNVLALKMGIGPQTQPPLPESQFPQYVLERTENIFQGVRKNAMEVYFRDNASYGKDTTAPEMMEWYAVYVLQPKADNREKTVFFSFSTGWTPHCREGFAEQ